MVDSVKKPEGSIPVGMKPHGLFHCQRLFILALAAQSPLNLDRRRRYPLPQIGCVSKEQEKEETSPVRKSAHTHSKHHMSKRWRHSRLWLQKGRPIYPPLRSTCHVKRSPHALWTYRRRRAEQGAASCPSHRTLRRTAIPSSSRTAMQALSSPKRYGGQRRELERRNITGHREIIATTSPSSRRADFKLQSSVAAFLFQRWPERLKCDL